MAMKFVVAIDLGTTRSAWAYTVKGKAEGSIFVKIPDGVAAAPSSSKTETTVLLGHEGMGKVVAFGPAALKRVLHGRTTDEALFRYFKVGLINTEGHKYAEDLVARSTKSTGGRQVPLLGVVTASLDYFKDDILRLLSSLVGMTLYARNVEWVLTVPAIYDDIANHLMRKAAFNAGMIDRVDSSNLRLCLESEAACVCITTGDNPLTVEAKGKQIMILDCGGGHVGITTHHVQSVDPVCLSEESTPGGGPWGSTNVDNEFREWLKRFLGGWFDIIVDSEELLAVMMAWEQTKMEFTGPDSGPLWFNLGGLSECGLTSADLKVGTSYGVSLAQQCVAPSAAERVLLLSCEAIGCSR